MFLIDWQIELQYRPVPRKRQKCFTEFAYDLRMHTGKLYDIYQEMCNQVRSCILTFDDERPLIAPLQLDRWTIYLAYSGRQR